MNPGDTIAAISTPLGVGGIGIVRLSGPQARQVFEKIFRRRGADGPLLSHHFYLGEVLHPQGRAVIDEVLAVFMEKPRTYTREDVVEIQAHSGILILQEILNAVLQSGARLAEPGEFTKRAFLNGRIDLTQAEAVIDLIRSKTRKSLEMANLQRQGRLGTEVRQVRDRLLDLLAQMEASIDFPEDEVPELSGENIHLQLQGALERLNSLLQTYEQGKVYREGVSAVIVGRPNVGKSSLLNALLREDRAIVTPFPGTTRDVIEEGVNVRGIFLKLMDTAGLHQTKDAVEGEGVRRTWDRLAQADLVIWVVDGSEPLTPDDLDILREVRDKRTVVAINKNDLPLRVNLQDLSGQMPGVPLIPVSALHHRRISHLEDAIRDRVLKGTSESSSEILLSNLRHKQALERAREGLERATEASRLKLSVEFLSVDLGAALQALGEVVGETTSEDLLERIFSRFCIGK
ncbi:MAG TPA: tRNA uridine-5-carboxymethylaminomethyl(34) synthesis GTPase MnmE [Thermodesulfobacteriota bacterium]|nr:tRNA uridine-5-carboxymethylaminomethyl(34) synthesis GTPase MnmE [Thermodesulfobacteriota bacterium]